MAGQKKKILIVEDETILAEEIKVRLTLNNYEATCAYDGQQGLDKAREENPDLIILDLMLPKIDGYRICGLLKGDVRFRHIPIIILTAVVKNFEGSQAMEQELKPDAFMSKPFEPQVLLSKIKELLAK